MKKGMLSLLFMLSSAALLLFLPESEISGSQSLKGFLMESAGDQYDSDIHSLSECSEEENEESVSRLRNQRTAQAVIAGGRYSNNQQVGFVRIRSFFHISLFQDVIKNSHSLRAPPAV